MARKNRQLSSTGVYHVIWRGVGRQNIFIDGYDHKKFLYILEDCKERFELEIYAYCLMSNHVHILLKADDISTAMADIGKKYALWFNTKYERNGHLFQDRFMSEPVEDDRYFVTVVRYIHQNPVKAGMVSAVDEYEWSSYKDYTNKNDFINYFFLLDMIGENNFVEFNNMATDESCLDISEIRKKITDEKAVELILKYAKINSVYDINDLPDKEKTYVFKKLLDNNASLGQMERLTGIRRCNIILLTK